MTRDGLRHVISGTLDEMTARPLTEKAGRRAWRAAAIFLAVAAAIALTARGPGLTMDEPLYIGRALNYTEWFQGLSARNFTWPVIREHWGYEDHPPLGSLWIALNMRLFGGAVDLLTAARIGAALLFGVAAAAIFLWIASKRGEREGLVAAAVFVLMPRLFAHGHFANIEMATLLLWLLTVIAFERGIERRGWSVACGALFGLALLTKINAVFLPVLLLPWGLLFHGRKALRNIAAMALCGPLIFLIGWPVMWYHPAAALHAYLADKAQRMIIPVYYLGTAYRDRVAPWHYPFVMLLATTPLPVLVALTAGAWRYVRTLRAKWSESAHEALVVWGFLFPVCLLALPGVPKYDGIRLMLPAYPFLAALAAAGAVAAWDSLGRGRRWAGAACAAVLAAWLLLPVVAFHPYQLCYYGELAGGPWGAAKLGFETTYWDDTFDSKALDYLNKEVPPDGKVAFVAVPDYIWQFYQGLGEARRDIRMGDFGDRDWDYLVVVPRRGYWLTDAERAFINSPPQPAWANTLWPGGTPVCLIYERRTIDERR
jgi:4-amino-4-deoxy-L-arabinose transferase-like glycosyltransferase